MTRFFLAIEFAAAAVMLALLTALSPWLRRRGRIGQSGQGQS